MKKTIVFAFAATFLQLSTASTASATDIELQAGNVEIVIATNAPKTVRLALRELQTLLGGVFDSALPVCSAPSGEKPAILLGADACASYLPSDEIAALPRDAFIIRALNTREGPRICIAGRDDPKADPDKVYWTAGLWMQIFERATLFGVYEFLECYAGVRMYFSGELGTVIPRRDCLFVPEGTRTVVPLYMERSFSFSESGAWFEGEDRTRKYHPQMMLNGYRLRMQTDYKPCVHGINALDLGRRFRERHPEWFTLDAKGHRGDRLCWSSPIVDEIYKDVRGYFLGEECETRGFNGRKWINRGWPYNMWSGRWVDLMPQDGFQKCHCKACLAAVGVHTNNYATVPVWSMVAAIGRRLKAEGVPGRLTCMAYWPYHDVPSFDLPDNVDVMVATCGPWSETRPGGFKKDLHQAEVWKDKIGRPVWLWTYANKWGNRELPDVPQMAPRSWGNYYKAAHGLITGAFAESESDRFLYNYLNYYVFSKVCWDVTLDVEELLAEHHRLMFGAAAREMSTFFDALERKWMREIVGNWEDSPLGPMMTTPSDNKLWLEIYSVSFMKKLDHILCAAKAKVSSGSVEARRIDLFRREFFEPLKARGDSYRRASVPPPEWRPSDEFEISGNGIAAKSFTLGAKREKKFPQLEHGARYRLSFYIRTENVQRTRPRGEAGACGNIWVGTSKKGYNLWFPGVRWFLGTMGWTRQEYIFTVRSDIPDLTGSLLRFALQHASGKMWISDVRLERVSEKTSGK